MPEHFIIGDPHEPHIIYLSTRACVNCNHTWQYLFDHNIVTCDKYKEAIKAVVNSYTHTKVWRAVEAMRK